MSGGDGYLTNPLYREIAKLMTDAGITHRVEQGAKHFKVKFTHCGVEREQILHLGPNNKGSTYRKTVIRFRKIVAAERAWLEQKASAPKEIVMLEEPKPALVSPPVAKEPACSVSPIYMLISRVLREHGIAFRVEPRAAYDVLFAMCRTGEKRIDIRPNAKPNDRTIENAEMWLKRIVALKPFASLEEAHSRLQVQTTGSVAAEPLGLVSPIDLAPTSASLPDVVPGIIGGTTVQTVNARGLHAYLHVGKDFSTWIKDRIEQYEFEVHRDFEVFTEIGGNPDGGRPTKEYALTVDMAKELAMVERNGQGKKARQHFIECERRLKNGSADLSDPFVLRSLLLAGTERVIALEEKVEEMRPQVDAYERIAVSDGSIIITDAAKTLQVRRSDLFSFLRAHRWTYRRVGSGTDVAYQDKINAGLLEHKITIIPRPDGTEKIATQVRVTSKGLTRLAHDLPRAGIKVYQPDLFASAPKGREQ